MEAGVEAGVHDGESTDEDESRSNSDSSLAFDCPSWMLEDFEGPWDDIFTNTPTNYTRTMLQILMSLIRDKRKKETTRRGRWARN